MADGIGQFGTIKGIEMEVFNPFSRQDLNHIDGHVSTYHLTGRGIVI